MSGEFRKEVAILFVYIHLEGIFIPTLFYFNELKRDFNNLKVRFIRIILELYIQTVVKGIVVADFPTKSLKFSTPSGKNLVLRKKLMRFFFK